MTRRLFALIVFVAAFGAPAALLAQDRPNIVVILADDLGYGDTSGYGATALKTPSIDRLAKEGLRFTDAHASAATCTPSRYALLTGEYAWRRPGTGILPGDAALIIHPGRTTVASMLKKAGYATGVVGKWHLGLGEKGGPDWNGTVAPGANEIGFDYSFLMPATIDRVPTVYVENRRVVNLDPSDPIKVDYDKPVGDWPTGKDHPELLRMKPSHGHDGTIVNGISRIGFMTGGKAALWKDEEMAAVFTAHATKFIEDHHDAPFFLYFALHEPHVPRVPNPQFVGKTTMGPRGDAIIEEDWAVSQILATLDRLHLTQDTLVIFTSDNGPVLDDGYQDGAEEKVGNHKPANGFRGGKYSNFEGGTRIPFIVRWPGHVKAGISDALVCQIDFLASFAALTKQTLGAGDGPDSENVLAALLGKSSTGRRVLVEQGNGLAIRQENWKYIEPSNRPKVNPQTHTEMGNDPQPQLYELSSDPGERSNVAERNVEKTKELAELLRRIRKSS
jgi:arylsulfatase A-like enzyme